MVQILPPLNYVGKQEKESGLGNFLKGVGSGLQQAALQKSMQMQRASQRKQLRDSGLNDQAVNLLEYVREVDPSKFVQVLQSLGPDAYNQYSSNMESPVQEQESISVSPKKISEKVTISKPKSLFEDKEAKKREHENQKLINKEVFPFIKDVQSKAKGAKENDLRLTRMEKLIETGKLNNPTFSSLLKTLKHGIWGVGLDLTHLLNPESQEFEKLSSDFIKNAKDVFGGRVTDQDLKAFLATIPNLSMTNEGKSAVIHNLKLLNKGAELREQASRKLLKKYGNKPPLDFESEVEDLIKPELDSIAKSFEQGSHKKSGNTTMLPVDLLGTIGQTILGNR